MISLRRQADRLHREQPRQESWLTFFPGDRDSPLGTGFGTLELFNECRMPPLSEVAHDLKDVELLTYVLSGTLSYLFAGEDVGVLQAGELQCVTGAAGLTFVERNDSGEQELHFLEIAIRTTQRGLLPGHAENHAAAAPASTKVTVLAGLGSGAGSLALHQDATLSRLILSSGESSTVHVGTGRGVWMHVVQGEVVLAALSLKAGDSLGIRAEHVIELRAISPTEVFLLDLGRLA